MILCEIFHLLKITKVLLPISARFCMKFWVSFKSNLMEEKTFKKIVPTSENRPLSQIRRELKIKWYRCTIETKELRKLSKPSDSKALFMASFTNQPSCAWRLKKLVALNIRVLLMDSIEGFAHRKWFLGTEFFKLRFRLWKTKSWAYRN